MKKIKKLLAMLLAMTMVLGMSATVLAENEDAATSPATGTAEDKGTIEVKGIEEGETVYAFQVVKAVYEDGKFNSKYQSLYEALKLNDNSTAILDEGLADSLGQIKAGLTKGEDGQWDGVSADADADFGSFTMTASDDGYTKRDVPVGSYLILVEGAENHFYAPIIVSVSYVVNDGESQVEGSSLLISSQTAWAKVIDKPSIDKTADTGNETDTSSANVGDLITYAVTVDPIPAYDGAHPRFNIVDTLGNGLAFATVEDVQKIDPTVTAEDQTDLIKVYVGDTLLSKDHYTATINNDTKELKVDFVKSSGGTKENGYMLYDYNGQSLKVVYQAKITDEALMNSSANENTAKLNYSKDSNVESDDENDPDTPEAKTYTYTFDLSGTATGSEVTSIVNKVGEEVDTETGEKKPLPGAQFTLYTDAACEYVYSGNTLVPDGVVTSGTNGELVIRGLAAGTYYLKETLAPTGYSLNTDVYKIVLEANYKKDSNQDDVLDFWNVEITNTTTGKTDGVDIDHLTSESTEAPDETLNIPNTKLSSLPSTGGIGTTIFTIGGCALMILAAGLYFATRRKTAK